MKKIFPFLALMVVLSACHHDDPEVGVDFSKKDNQQKYFVPYRERDCDILQEKPWNTLPTDAHFDASGRLIVDHLRKASSLVTTDLARGIIESVASYKVHQVCGTYQSTDVNGENITVSGAVFYPLDLKIKNIIVCSHYTVAANYEAPSQTFPLEAAMAAKGYLVVMADYIGYGATRDHVHPYLQAEVTARNVIDMALSVYPFIEQRGLKIASDSIILVGYSQGGATSMWVQYYMENDPVYKGEFKILKNYCGGGPYDVAKTYDYCAKLKETGIPYAVPMIILGMSEGMPEPLKMEKFFKEPLLSNYSEWFNSKRYNGPQLTQLIGYNRLDSILTPDGLDRSVAETKRLYRALQVNSIPLSFRPQAPVFLYHSMDDQTVPFINAQVVRYNFTHYTIQDKIASPIDNVEYDLGHYGNHQAGCIKFFLKMFQVL